MTNHLQFYRDRLQHSRTWRWHGSVVESIGQTVESAGPISAVGESCEIIDRFGNRHPAEVIGFRGSHVLSMPVATTDGIRFGDPVTALGTYPEIGVGEALLGRVLDASGCAMEGPALKGPLAPRPIEPSVRTPLERVPIREALSTGVRVIDGLLTVGRGQRVGIFGGSGVGKSTLIGMMTRNTDADLTIVGLVGERGREVGEFLNDSLGQKGRARSVVVVSTSDQSPLMRMRAALAATTIAEYFAGQGKRVLLILDSLTRFAMAAREIGLAAGEPPTAKGYTPSVFARLAKLVERAGNFQTGSITAFYTVLMEGDDLQDPLVDAVRSLLDGHVVLSRAVAAEGWYPPVDVLSSISRLMPAVTSAVHREQAAVFRRLLSIHARSEDLVRIGAYKPGADSDLDRALKAQDRMRAYRIQDSSECCGIEDSVRRLAALAAEI